MKTPMTELNAVKVVGRGAMGTVLLVQREGCDRPLALKAMSKSAMARNDGDGLRRAHIEKNILSRLDHPFLPTLFGHVETEKIMAWLVEYCPGGDLNTLRHRQTEKTFSESIIRFYAAEIVLALEHLHSLGIVYRDLKPENVLIQASGHVMLTDFDLSASLEVDHSSKQLASGSDIPQDSNFGGHQKRGLGRLNCFSSFLNKKTKCPSPLARSVTIRMPPVKRPACVSPAIDPAATVPGRLNSFVGTEEYVSPEMLRATGHGFAVDWWALGILLYEMLYGYTPFKGVNRKETFYNILIKEPQFTGPWMPLRDLILRLLEKEPEKRVGFSHGAHHIKSHAFFRGVNWDSIHKVSRPPFIPCLLPIDDMKEIEGVDIEECVENLQADMATKIDNYKQSSRSEDCREGSRQNWVERLSRAKEEDAHGVF